MPSWSRAVWEQLIITPTGSERGSEHSGIMKLERGRPVLGKPFCDSNAGEFSMFFSFF